MATREIPLTLSEYNNAGVGAIANRMPDNVAVFKLGHWERMVLTMALDQFADESATKEKWARNLARTIGGHEMLVTLMLETHPA